MNSQSVITRKKDFTSRNSRYHFLLTNYKEGKVLDIGNIGGLYGGEGTVFSSHLKFIDEAKESVIYGFDLYPPKANVEKYTNQRIGDIETGLPYEDAFFDTVYLGEVIEHLCNPGSTLKEIHRVLKTDGILILDTPNAYSARKLLKWFFKREENLGDPTHIIIFTPGSLVALLKKNGFLVRVLGEKTSPLSWFGMGLGSHLLIKATKDIAE